MVVVSDWITFSLLFIADELMLPEVGIHQFFWIWILFYLFIYLFIRPGMFILNYYDLVLQSLKLAVLGTWINMRLLLKTIQPTPHIAHLFIHQQQLSNQYSQVKMKSKMLQVALIKNTALKVWNRCSSRVLHLQISWDVGGTICEENVIGHRETRTLLLK